MEKDKDLKGLLGRAHRIHFTGIGGISMSALAEILHNKGYSVSGSDLASSGISIDRLRKLGITLYCGQRAENIKGAEAVIRTAAVHDENCEIAAARTAGIPVFERAQLLGVVLSEFKCPISIAGTHGKTTTTSMLSQILLCAGLDPTCLVGGQLSAIGGNIRIGNGDYVVCEACEYYDSFLSLSHKIAVVLNIEEDHLDYFTGGIKQIKNSFKRFINIAGEGGHCVICGDDSNCVEAAAVVLPKVTSYSIENEKCDVYAGNIAWDENGLPSFDVYCKGKLYGHMSLSVPGKHNIKNALAACSVSWILGLDSSYAAQGLELFRGTKRRFERIGMLNGALIVDDYAHHPTEIKATLAAARNMGFKRIVCLFQPHTYTRTAALFDRFVDALSGFDGVGLAEIYAAREKNTNGISSKMLADKINKAVFLNDLGSVAQYIKDNAHDGDLFITMGAGDIYKAGLKALGNINK
jgi:UDP-N-acetylmuramate--alanine ligase